MMGIVDIADKIVTIKMDILYSYSYCYSSYCYCYSSYYLCYSYCDN